MTPIHKKIEKERYKILSFVKIYYMWQSLGKAVLRFRIPLIIALVLLTAFMGYHASKVQMSYDFSRAIPTDHPKYKAYLEFKKTFGEDGNLLTIGFIAQDFFKVDNFNALTAFQERLKKIDGVEDILSVNGAITLKKNDNTGKLDAIKIFPARVASQPILDSLKNIFYTLPFYRGLLYNTDTKAYLLGLRINRDVLGSKERERVIGAIEKESAAFAETTQFDLHLSGLPLIRTNVALRIAQEMQWFLLGYGQNSPSLFLCYTFFNCPIICFFGKCNKDFLFVFPFITN